MGSPYRHVISLGGDCTAAAQLSRVAPQHVSSPYDWLVTPWDALCNSLEDGGQGYARSIVLGPNETIRCGSYGMGFVHEFPRRPEGGIVVDADGLSDCRNKLLHKHRRMAEAAAEGRTLFVRYRAFTDFDDLASRVLDPEHVDRLMSALRTMAGHDLFDVLLLVPSGYHLCREVGEEVAPGLGRARFRIERLIVERDDPILGDPGKFEGLLTAAIDGLGSGLPASEGMPVAR